MFYIALLTNVFSLHVLYYFVCIVITNVIYCFRMVTLSWNKHKNPHIGVTWSITPQNPTILHVFELVNSSSKTYIRV